jgi:hypothetical protein
MNYSLLISKPKQNQMKQKLLLPALWTLLPAALLSLTSCSSTPTPPPDQASAKVAYSEGVPGGVMVKTFKTTAVVTAIDYTTRQATLLGSDGKKFSVKVGLEAVNFDQVRVGDHVKATLTQQLVVGLGKEGAASGDGAAGVVLLAAKGAPPGGLVAGTTQVTARILAMDLKRHTATLRFEDGTTKTFPVRPDVDLRQRQIGEQVVFRVTEMIALSVEKP